MSGTVSISVIGGDLRQKILAEFLEKDGFSVKTAGFDMEESDSEYDISDLAKSDVVILPLPVSYDNTSVNTPLGKDTIYIKDILENMPKESVLLGGRISEYLQGEMDSYGINYSDYFMREELVVQNAIPTVSAVRI